MLDPWIPLKPMVDGARELDSPQRVKKKKKLLLLWWLWLWLWLLLLWLLLLLAQQPPTMQTKHPGAARISSIIWTYVGPC